MTTVLRPGGRAGARRAGLHTLAVTVLLVFFTMIMGLSLTTNLQDRVAGYLEIMEGELATVSAVHRNDTLHVRANFRHLVGSGFDRVAVSELTVGGAYIERDGSPLVSDHAALEYGAAGWPLHDGTACASWGPPVVRPWPASWPPPPPPPPATPSDPCVMHVYQRVDGGDARPGRFSLSNGDAAVLEFVIVGVGLPAGTGAGIAAEYGRGDRTAVTGNAGVSIYGGG